MDQMVLATQQWLNATYGNVKGFTKVPEDGKTGWSTIYGLIEGLQHELGITGLVANFGSGTATKWDAQITNKLKTGYSGNVVYLIQGAFWCKGISPSAFDGKFTSDTQVAMTKLQNYAGFPNGDGAFSSVWAKALFDMSAFVNIGDSKIREMQQWLNVNYNYYFGILPCDGIYQRATNTALIYALQDEEGLGNIANGNYGNSTTLYTPTLNVGDSGTFVTILQYALYANGFYKSGAFDGNYTNEVATAVSEFASFMHYEANTGVTNVTIFKGLLSSAGDTDRPADGVDTATQLTPAQIQTLEDNGIHYVGRYLTGSVGSGASELDKSLSITEIDNILSSINSIFPIYEDGGYSLDYFTASQGTVDGISAGEAAKRLTIPTGTVIYFAVDVDVEDGDIDGTVIPYFKNVYAELTSYGYQVGVYGTRNVCARVISTGNAVYAFVSDMSTGYSGNLGFAMPQDWAFDQFDEVTLGAAGSGMIDVDRIATSGLDLGFQSLYENTTTIPDSIFRKMAAIGIIWPALSDVTKLTVEAEEEFVFKSLDYNMYSTLSDKISIGDGDNEVSFNISKGEISDTFTDTLNSLYSYSKLPESDQKVTVFNELGKAVNNGAFSVIPAPPRPEETGNVGIELKFKLEADDIADSSEEFEWSIQVYFKKTSVDSSDADTVKAYDSLVNLVDATTTDATSLLNKTVSLAHTLCVGIEQHGAEIVDTIAVTVTLAAILTFLVTYGPFLLVFI